MNTNTNPTSANHNDAISIPTNPNPPAIPNLLAYCNRHCLTPAANPEDPSLQDVIHALQQKLRQHQTHRSATANPWTADHAEWKQIHEALQEQLTLLQSLQNQASPPPKISYPPHVGPSPIPNDFQVGAKVCSGQMGNRNFRAYRLEVGMPWKESSAMSERAQMYVSITEWADRLRIWPWLTGSAARRFTSGSSVTRRLPGKGLKTFHERRFIIPTPWATG
jgi:hypothetical protein